MAGNPTPRIIETAAGMINAIGLQNMGVRPFIAEKLPKLQHIKDVVVIANVFGFTIEDCLEVISALNDAPGIAMYELNASCPNTSHGGMVFGTDPTLLYELVARTKGASQRPLMVKLSPNVTSIGQMARVAADAGADAVSLVNTFVSLAIDVETRRPRIANVTGGLSGPAIKPIAVRMVHDVSKAVRIPIVGMGGILSAEDAVRVHDGRSHRRPGRHRQLRRPPRCGKHRQRPQALVLHPQRPASNLPHRLRPPLSRTKTA